MSGPLINRKRYDGRFDSFMRIGTYVVQWKHTGAKVGDAGPNPAVGISKEFQAVCHERHYVGVMK